MLTDDPQEAMSYAEGILRCVLARGTATPSTEAEARLWIDGCLQAIQEQILKPVAPRRPLRRRAVTEEISVMAATRVEAAEWRDADQGPGPPESVALMLVGEVQGREYRLASFLRSRAAVEEAIDLLEAAKVKVWPARRRSE